MYIQHFKLSEEPFSITPDPAFVYMSARHREALGHLLYGTGRHGGFVQLTGEVGTGKTTIVRTLLAQDLDGVDAAVILNPRQSEQEFLASICDELHLEYAPDASQKALVDGLNQHLLAAHANGRRTVLIIDEAQNLNRDVLETVRLLTNLETHKEKLLRIMLVGQPELSDLLSREDLRQVAQRITARFHLTPLSLEDTREYIAHRLRIAGGHAQLFDANAIRRVHKLSNGTPRLINIICDRALLGAYGLGRDSVDAELVNRAAAEVLGGPPPRAALNLPAWALPAGLAAVMLILAVALWPREAPTLAAATSAQNPAPATATAPVASTPAPQPLPERTQPNASTTEPAKEAASTGQATVVPIAVVSEAADPQDAPASGLGLNQLLIRLAADWGLGELSGGSGYCAEIKQLGLRCYRSSASLSTLRSMNRPAILTLAAESSAPSYALLRSLDDRQASVLGDDGQLRTLDIEQLQASWTGDFLMIWKPETTWILINPSTRGEPVSWLRKKLNRIAGQALNDPESPEYDRALQQQISEFQRAHGLKVDGLVGTQTMIVLNDVDPIWNGLRLNNSMVR